ncbi:MAG: polysulfide reductase NrfD [Rhodospirillales bacterium]|jgi:formate-dependent nitrite reductase membrane component NrfD|nr:polysulfide reductase NrfD [Rhodospirillales bacterium]
MHADIHWGLPIILYFFLAGMGAGAGVISAFVLLRGEGNANRYGGHSFSIARIGALISVPMVGIGTAFLILELGSFEVGNYFRFLMLFTTVTMSPMSIGSWLLVVFMGVASLYALSFLKPDAASGDANDGTRRTMAMLMIPLGACVAIYTGVLLGAVPSRPFWNSPMLPMLFLFSSLSTGVAAIMIIRVFLNSESEGKEAEYRLAVSDFGLIIFEMLSLFLFVLFAFLMVGNSQDAILAIFSGGLASTFWIGVVVIGLLLPALLEARFLTPRLQGGAFAAPRAMEMLIPAAIIVGGFILRYVVVIAGQVTGPVGL